MDLTGPALPRRMPQAALLTPAEMARVDAAAGPGTELMEHAGRAVARAARRHFRPCRTLVLCGPGNNGGDGYVAARRLAAQGWPVTVAVLAPPRPGSDAARAAALWHGSVAAFAPEEAAGASLVIDAVFGAGLARDLAPEVSATLGAARRILAVDVPSGLDGETGAARGKVAAAALTVTFVRLKPGHVLLPGRSLCGALELAEIGMPPEALLVAEPCAFLNTPALWQVPRPGPESHKYTRGHVTVLGGAAMTGAARLAAAAARRVGAGMVTLAARMGADVYRTGEPGLIVNEAPLSDLLQDARRHVWVCGPGLGAEQARAAFPALVAAGRAVVADADALTAFAGEPDRLRGAAVLTPHAGEFARVFGPASADRVGAARAAAARTGAVLLLKGSDTVVAAPDGRVSINATAPPWLGTAGAGDVLAGMIAGLLAQGMPPWEAASAAAFLHGRAAVHAGAGMVVEDLLPAIRAALAEVGAA